MKTCSCQRLILLLVAAVVFAAVFSFSMSENVADAIDFELVYPDNGYVQIENAELISANADYVAVCDKTAGKILVVGDKSFSFSLADAVNGIYVIGDTLLVDCESGYLKADLSAVSPVLSPVSLPTPADIRYLTTDGISLYAHASGTIAKYDDDLNLLETYLDTAFSSAPVFVSDGNKIYLYSVEYGENKYTVYDVASRNSSKVNSDITAVATAICDVIYVQNRVKISGVDTTTLLAVDKNNGEILFDSGLSVSAFSAYGDRLYVADGTDGYSVYQIDAADKTLDLIASYSMSGSALDKLDNPNDVKLLDGVQIITDTDNDRVLFNGDTVSAITVTAPTSLALGKSRIYVAGGRTVSVIENGEVTSEYLASEDIIDIAYCDRLYALTESKILVLEGGRFDDFITESGIAITAAEDGKFLYLLADNGITAVTASGDIMFKSTLSLTNAKDISADYKGNLFVLNSNNTITEYKTKLLFTERYIASNAPALSSYSGETPLSLDNDSYTATPNSLAAGSDGNLYFTSEENLLGKVLRVCTDKASFAPTQAPQIQGEELMPYTVNAETLCYLEPQRFDTVDVLENGTEILIFDTESGLSGYKFGVYRNKTVFIAENSLVKTDCNPINKQYIANKATTFYRYPNSTDENMLYAINRTLLIIDDAGDFDGAKWYRTKYNDVFYFVAREDVTEYVAPVVTEEKEKQYGRAKAQRAGGTVKLYQLADNSSTVLVQLTDGKKVTVLETYEDFYYVEYDGIVGYVQKDDIVLDGLTTVQIIAIVLAAVVLLAGIGVFLLTKRLKRNAEEEY